MSERDSSGTNHKNTSNEHITRIKKQQTHYSQPLFKLETFTRAHTLPAVD